MVIHSVDAVNRPASPEDLTAICTYGLFFLYLLPPTVSPSHRLSLSLTHSLSFLLSFAIGE